jgi:Lar family restriction alleviation protein
MKNETTAELLPCPFCGSEASLTQIESAGGDGRMIWIVGCEECEVAFRGHARKVDAAKDWNTRTPTSQIAVLRTALERIVAWEMPKTGRYWDMHNESPENEMSYEACYGTHGEKAVIQNIAREALEADSV